jgi:peptide/nickel transport system substrate-binding protein
MNIYIKATVYSAILVFSILSLPMMTHAQTATSTFAVGWNGAPMDTVNPMAITLFDGGAKVVLGAIYDKLVRPDNNGALVPDLAQSWTWNDPTTLVINLVHNATWQDGQPLNANDVVYTINLMLKSKAIGGGYVYTHVAEVQNVTAVDQYTVRIKLNAPTASFMTEGLGMTYILPQHVWQNIGNYSSYPNTNAVGSGPFRLTSWQANSFAQLDANPNYFLGSPHVQHVTIRYFTSADAMVLALQSGEIDVTGPILPPSVVPGLAANGNIQVVSKPDQRYFYLSFNAYPNGTGNPALRDERVRRALAYGIDKKQLAQTVWQGFAETQNSIMPLSLGMWHNPNTQDIPFNLTVSAKMLDDAGYKVGADGIRASPSGVKLAFRLEVPSNYAEEFRSAQIIAGWWGQIGVKATPQLVDPNTLGNEIGDWKHDAFIWTWSAESLDPDLFVNIFTTAQVCVPGCLSDSGFSDPTYDQLYQQQHQATDPAQRQKILWQMQDLIAAHVPYVALYDPDAIQGFRADLFTGLNLGVLPPLTQYSSINLFTSVRPIASAATTATTVVTTTSVTSGGISTSLVAAIAALVVIVVAALVLLTRRRKPAT